MTTALVLGGAACLWLDIRATLDLGVKFDQVVACNDAIAHWPYRLDAAVSYHPELFPRWLKIRAVEGYQAPSATLAHLASLSASRRVPGVRYVDPNLPGQVTCGSSGLFALKIALVDLTCDRAVLCGVPMVDGEHFVPGPAFDAADEHRVGWLEALPALRERARSMSGWTAALLGQPTADWLNA